VPFKRAAYEMVAKAFASFAARDGAGASAA
jgi:hypothetical protein